MNAPEMKLIPHVDATNRYLDQSIEEIEFFLDQMAEKPHNNWDELNSFFLEIVGP